jgi:large subunit ribosomal protein L35
MPKIKTRKGATKRFKITKNGKVLAKKQGLRHILTKKGSKRKRQLGIKSVLKECEAKKIIRMMPYAR